MHTIQVKLYEYKELSPKAKQKALEWMREGNSVDTLEEDFKYALHEEFGISGVEVNWRLSYCQGDGVDFHGHLDMDVFRAKHKKWNKFFRKLEKKDNSTVWIEIRHEGHYHHWNSMVVDVGTDSFDDHEEIVEIQEYVQDLCKEASRRLEKLGYDEIQYQNSEENLAEVASINGWLFEESGRHSKFCKEEFAVTPVEPRKRRNIVRSER